MSTRTVPPEIVEANVDAIVGPTHHFGGLGIGNLASQEHRGSRSSPKRAALEGLRKAAWVASCGVPQFVFLPPHRPRWQFLARLGFQGKPAEQLAAALENSPEILSSVFSSSFMWAANCGTFSPATDCSDGKHHFTPANLISSWHRACEAEERSHSMRQLLPADSRFTIHDPLPAIMPLRDEGAANHMRLSDCSGRIGFNIFVFGVGATTGSTRFMPRQTHDASTAISRLHGLDPGNTFFLQQHPQAIDAGVFHNDVIATSHEGLLIHHETAFLEGEAELVRLERRFAELTGVPLRRVVVSGEALSLADAVDSYFFNSQILTVPSADGHQRLVLLCPQQCADNQSASKLVSQLIADPTCPIDDVKFISLQQSMANGGGPACLRIRLPVERGECDRWALRLDAALEELLAGVIERLYPDSLEMRDLLDIDCIQHLERIPGEMAAAALRANSVRP